MLNDLAVGARSLIPVRNLKEAGPGLPGEYPPLVLLHLTTAADRSWRGWRSTEQPLEERRAGGEASGEAAAIAGKAHAGRQRGGRTAIARLRMCNHVFEVPIMRSLEQRKHGGVAAIDVLADLQLASL